MTKILAVTLTSRAELSKDDGIYLTITAQAHVGYDMVVS